MKTTRVRIACVAASVALAVASGAVAQQQPRKKPVQPRPAPVAPRQPSEVKPAEVRPADRGAAREAAQPAEAGADWMAFAQPGPEHARLNDLVGTWDGQVRFWMSPEAPPDVSQGTSRYYWVLGGRYLRQEIDGASPMGEFHGLGYTGFDKAAGKYFSTWMDTMGTGLLMQTGTYDEREKTFTLEGVYRDPAAGERRLRSVIRLVDADTHIYEMFDVSPDGSATRTLQIVYTRRAAAPGAAPGRAQPRPPAPRRGN